MDHIDRFKLCSLDNIETSSEIDNKNQSKDTYDISHELDKSFRKYHHSYYHNYNLWKSEVFKAKAFEKQNEKLESRVKYLESKLEKETYQQIKISLEWRKTVTNLVDENTRLKSLLFKCDNCKSSLNSDEKQQSNSSNITSG